MTEDTMTLTCVRADARVAELHEALRQQVNEEAIPSGILVESPQRAEQLRRFDGTSGARVASSLDWTTGFNVLIGSQVRALGIAAADLEVQHEALRAEGVIPIGIVDFEFEFLRNRWSAHVAHAVKADAAPVDIPAIADVVAPGVTFLAAALPTPAFDLFTPVPGKHYGLHARFVLPADGYRTNTDRTLQYIELDLGDGAVRRAMPGEVVEHSFADEGHKVLSLTAHTSDGAARVARFALEVAASAPAPNQTWEFVDPVDPKLTATAWVYFALTGPRRKLEKPVLLAEGFPGGRSLDALWPLVNQSHFVRELLGKGRDFVILGFKDGTRLIQDNARLYTACVERIIAEKQNGEKIAAGGASMGGLIARYALADMELNGKDHQVDTFFTVDTPHEGANIPVSSQAFIQLYGAKPCGGEAVAAAKQLASPAAQQMLLQWIPPYAEWVSGRQYPVASPLRAEFLRELERRQWMPQKVTRRIGVADGVATGVGLALPPGAHAVWFGMSTFHWANLHASEAHPHLVVAMANGLELWSWHAGGRRIDGAPGGTRDTWGELHDGLPGLLKSVAHRHHCFVPSVSACAIRTQDLYLPGVDQQPSLLHAFKCSSTTNLEHVALPVELKNFLVEAILSAEDLAQTA